MGLSTSRPEQPATALLCRGGAVVHLPTAHASALCVDGPLPDEISLADTPARAARLLVEYASYHHHHHSPKRPSASWDAAFLARLDEDTASELEHAASVLRAERLRRLVCARIGELSPEYRRAPSVPLLEAAAAALGDTSPLLGVALFDAELLPAAREALEPRTVTVLRTRAAFESASADELARVHAIVTTVCCAVTAADMDRCPSLRAVVTLSVGVDHVDVGAARERGARVYSSPGSNASAVAEHAVALMLGVQRCLHRGGEQLRARQWDRRACLGRGMDECTVGLVGFGRIAQKVADRLAPFGARFLVYDSFVPADEVLAAPSIRGGRGRVAASLDELLRGSDIVSLHVPLLPATRGMIGREQFAAMRPGSVIVNTARGGVIDDEALAEALESGPLFGAGVDVFTTEPPEYSVTDRLLAHENVILTPHIGAMTRLAREKMQTVAVGWLCSDIAAGAFS